MRLADEMLDHFLGDFEVGDHARAKRPDRAQVVRRLAHHQLRVVADRTHLAHAVLELESDDGRLAGDNALTADIDDGIGRPEVDRDASRREVEQTAHWSAPRPKNRIIKGLGGPRVWAIWLMLIKRGAFGSCAGPSSLRPESPKSDSSAARRR